LSANVNINYCLPIKVYYRICTLGHIRIEKFLWQKSFEIYAQGQKPWNEIPSSIYDYQFFHAGVEPPD
jgi:hypothetical protein